MEESVKKTIALGVVSWTLAFVILRRVFRKYSFEFSNRLVSTVHATLAVTFASLSVQDWKCPLCPMASTSSPEQVGIIIIKLIKLGSFGMKSVFYNLLETLADRCKL